MIHKLSGNIDIDNPNIFEESLLYNLIIPEHIQHVGGQYDVINDVKNSVVSADVTLDDGGVVDSDAAGCGWGKVKVM